MATQLVRGMGSFSKNCRCTRPNRCAHPYVVRYRDGTGRQREETGFTTQQDALDRLTKVYNEKRHTPERQASARTCPADHAGQAPVRGAGRRER